MFLEMILPSDKYKKYIDLVLGLILTLTLISPLYNLNKSCFVFNQKVFNRQTSVNKNMLAEIYKKSVERQINMLAEKMGIIILDLELEIEKENNFYEISNIKGKLADNTQKENFIKALSLIYILDSQNIILNWKNKSPNVNPG